MSLKLFTAATLFFSLFAMNSAEAATGSQFRSGASLFRRTESGKWEELQNGVPRYSFVQSAQSPEMVLLYDATRGINVKLTDRKCIVTQGSTTLVDTTGHWLWQEWRAADGQGRLTHEGNGDWVEYQNDRPTWRFREVSRGLDQIRLFDASRGITLVLSPSSNIVMSGPNTLMTVQGNWSK